MVVRRRPLQRLTDQPFEKIGQRPGVVRMLRRGIPRLLLLLLLNLPRLIVVTSVLLHAPRPCCRRPLGVRIGPRTEQPLAELLEEARLVRLAVIRLLGLHANHDAETQSQ